MKNAIRTTMRDFKFEENAKIALMEAIPTEYEPFLNPKRLYVAHFGAIPCESNIIGIDCNGAARWIVKNLNTEIIQGYRKRNYMGSSSISHAIFCLKDDAMLYFEFNEKRMMILYNVVNAKKVDDLIKSLRTFQQEDSVSPTMLVLVPYGRQFNTEVVFLDESDLNIDTHYNEDFREVHHIITEKLNSQDGKGLVLLHGAPGTGKTSYLRYLIGSLDKTVIYMPPSIAMEIGEPSLMALLLDNKESIFVIEDAESLIKTREGRPYSPVSAILNICDGLMSDFLKIQVVCTFNTDITKIDNALLRKGRLIARYEFKPLCTNKAQALSNQLGYETEINKPTTLSDIYNQNERSFEQLERVSIGFKAAASL